MRTTLTPEVGRALTEAGYAPGRVIGAGMEGVVVDLGSGLLAKAWHARQRVDLDRLAAFYLAVRGSGLSLATPSIVQVLGAGDQHVTIERRLDGRPLRESMSDQSLVAGDDEVSCLLQVLTDLRRGTPTEAMCALPVLDGGPSFAFGGDFGADLAALVVDRTSRHRAALSRRVPDVERVVTAVVSRLREAGPTPSALIHGDLVPANILVGDGPSATAVLDFGMFSTVGDPRFDAAVAASVFDMYGPRARRNEEILDDAVVAAFGYDPEVLHVYRAAYALTTSNYYSASGGDGHFEWCARMIQRGDVRDAIHSPVRSAASTGSPRGRRRGRPHGPRRPG